jgi:hypothetical protein
MTGKELNNSVKAAFITFAIIVVMFGLKETSFVGRLIHLVAFLCGWVFLDWAWTWIKSRA